MANLWVMVIGSEIRIVSQRVLFATTLAGTEIFLHILKTKDDSPVTAYRTQHDVSPHQDYESRVVPLLTHPEMGTGVARLSGTCTSLRLSLRSRPQ